MVQVTLIDRITPKNLGRRYECGSLSYSDNLDSLDINPIDLAVLATQFAPSYFIDDNPTPRMKYGSICVFSTGDGSCSLYRKPLGCRLIEEDISQSSEKFRLASALRNANYKLTSFNLLEYLGIPLNARMECMEIENIVGKLLKMSDLKEVLKSYKLVDFFDFMDIRLKKKIATIYQDH